ncbi:hypothetical protein [Streptomyces sp. NPDC053560]|uniref:hypothetical protein n=1 Tax=Streptomyces sp. NPDC053560 TaxID=3365711 RepID=UPI0037D7F121
MNRVLSVLLAGSSAAAQAGLLFGFVPVCRRVLAEQDLCLTGQARLLGVDAVGFVVRDPGHVGGWLPQLLFVMVCAVLTYAVLRTTPGLRPRWGTCLALLGAALSAAGAADLIGPVLHPLEWTYLPTPQDQPVLVRQTGGTGSAQFALLFFWMPIPMWAELWILRHWAPVRELLRVTGETGDEEGEEPVTPALGTRRERWEAVFAALIPAVLLAVAGGTVLRHTSVRQLEQEPALTFDPELWLPYRPPELADEWSEILYPALRLRPLPTETTTGWLATLLICLVLLVALAVALRAVVRRADARHPLRLFMRCWYATLLAAVAAAVVEGAVVGGDDKDGALPWLLAPRQGSTDALTSFDLAIGDAVRFGTAWGWATGAACLVAVLVMRRRGHGTEPAPEEVRTGHAQ